ncbi:predicted protein [Streptomyces sp. SPB78]|nr:predicted protein [Streptomyces sp. SPB78]
MLAATIKTVRGRQPVHPRGGRAAAGRQRVAARRGRKKKDAVVDFDRVIRDPGRAGRLLPAYDSGDHLHPSAEALARMADAVDLDALRPR